MGNLGEILRKHNLGARTPTTASGLTNEEAKQQIKDLILELIGEDDRDYSQDNTEHDSKIYLVAASTAANALRADLRKKVGEL